MPCPNPLNPLKTFIQSAALAAALCVPVAQAMASPLQFDPFSGQGNVSVFDAAAGTGGWVGSLDGLTDPATGLATPAVTTVLFTLDGLTHRLSGQFEFTTTDLGSTLSGLVQGTVSVDDILTRGGQFSLDYSISGGTGLFAGASGYGLSFLDFDPLAAPGSDNHVESGVMVYAVPEPASPLLWALALCALAGSTAAAGRRPLSR